MTKLMLAALVAVNLVACTNELHSNGHPNQYIHQLSLEGGGG